MENHDDGIDLRSIAIPHPTRKAFGHNTGQVAHQHPYTPGPGDAPAPHPAPVPPPFLGVAPTLEPLVCGAGGICHEREHGHGSAGALHTGLAEGATREPASDANPNPPIIPARRVTRADLAGAKSKLKRREIYVPELEGSIIVRGLSYGDQMNASQSATRTDSKGVKSVDDVEAQRQLLLRAFEEPELMPSDGPFLDNLPISVVVSITEAVVELSGLKGAKGEKVLSPSVFTDSRVSA